MQRTLSNRPLITARPFLKWAGGKTQLLDELVRRLPAEIIESGTIENYVEPFVGGGAMFFYLKRRFDINKSYLFDINQELVIAYTIIKNDPDRLIKELSVIECDYLQKSEADRQSFYYNIRDLYNKQSHGFNYKKYNKKWVSRTAFLIFLNKTCYNGLFRQNGSGAFNVPIGRYKNPKICDVKNLLESNAVLKDTEIIHGDFTLSSHFINMGSLVYLDPPYRPLNKTSHFKEYTRSGFSDNDQIRLSNYFKEMDKRGAFILLSNSDPRNENQDDDFFEQLYHGYNINKTLANRMINSNVDRRGQIFELVITNY